MSLKIPSAIVLSAAFALTTVVGPIAAQPSKAKACCGPSCPPPKQQPQSSSKCCHFVPARPPQAAASIPTPQLFLVAAVPVRPALVRADEGHFLSGGSDRSPPQPFLLAPSGLSPPSLA